MESIFILSIGIHGMIIIIRDDSDVKNASESLNNHVQPACEVTTQQQSWVTCFSWIAPT